MGLDMYAYKTLDTIDTPVDFGVATALQLHYWRKHPNLHGWMEALYREKGGEQEFNCVPVLLTAEDLDQLEAEHVYVLDPADQFRDDRSTRASDVRIGDLQVLTDGTLAVIERIEHTTRVHRVDVIAATNIYGTVWDDAAHRPALEQLDPTELAANGIVPVSKTLLFDSTGLGLPGGIEGLSFSPDLSTLTLINDNDCGVEGKETTVVQITISG